MTKTEKQARAERARALLEGGPDGTPEASGKLAPSGERHGTSRPSHPPVADPHDPPQPAGPQRRAASAAERRADLPRSHADPLSDALKPRRWESPPKRGDLVFYRGKRMWVQVAHPFDTSSFVRICSGRIRPDAPVETWHDKDHRESFYVHADELDLAPPTRSLTNLPTVASAKRREDAKRGIRDVGDEVATLLRGCDTLEETYRVSSEFLSVPVADLKAKYGHLNPGQQRMNLGNKMRFKWRKEHA